jgi:hypothetical protein
MPETPAPRRPSPRFLGILFWLCVWGAASFFALGIGLLGGPAETLPRIGREAVVAPQPTVAMPFGAPAVWGLVETTAYRKARHTPTRAPCPTVERGGPRVEVLVDGRPETLAVSWRRPIIGPAETRHLDALDALPLSDVRCPEGVMTHYEVGLRALRPGDRIYITGGHPPAIHLGTASEHLAAVEETQHGRGYGTAFTFGFAALCAFGAARLRRRLRATKAPSAS